MTRKRTNRKIVFEWLDAQCNEKIPNSCLYAMFPDIHPSILRNYKSNWLKQINAGTRHMLNERVNVAPAASLVVTTPEVEAAKQIENGPKIKLTVENVETALSLMMHSATQADDRRSVAQLTSAIIKLFQYKDGKEADSDEEEEQITEEMDEEIIDIAKMFKAVD